MKRTIFLMLISITVFNLSNAQTPQYYIHNFFKTYEQNEPVKALDALYATNPWMSRNQDDVVKLKTQFRDLKAIVGEYNGHELLYLRTVKDCFVLATFLVKYDRQPVRLNFKFYKPKNDWMLYSFSFDDSFDDDLEEAIKLEILELVK